MKDYIEPCTTWRYSVIPWLAITTWWRHQMETFSALLAICAGNFPHKGQWHRALMFSLICVWINGWVNNREAGDLRRYRAHYDVMVMKTFIIHNCFWHNWHTAGVIQINCMPNNCMHFITKKNMEIKLHTWNIFKIWVVFFPNVKKNLFVVYICKYYGQSVTLTL